MGQTVKTYETENIKICWRPEVCQHAGECVRGLSKVFNVHKRPWISPENAAPEEIMSVIDRCPSKALTYKKNEQD